MPTAEYDYNAYLAKNIHYPDSAREHNVEGRVIVKFVVKEDGTIVDCTVKKGVNKYLAAEALRIVSNMPSWKPGTKNGKPIKVYFTLPIKFQLED